MLCGRSAAKQRRIFRKFPQEEFRQTLEDLVRDEKETVDGVMQDIENLGNGAYLRKYAEKYNISETEARNELFTNLSSQLNELGMKCINKTHYPMPREIKAHHPHGFLRHG